MQSTQFQRTFALACFFVTVASSAPTNAVAQARNSDRRTPQAVVKQFGESLIARNWNVCANLIDPRELARNKAMFVPIFARDSSGQLSTRILATPRDSVVKALSDQEFNARLYAFFVGTASRGSAIDRFQGIDIDGVATPEPDHAFVIYSWKLPTTERPIRGAQTMELHRIKGEWYLDMLADFESLRDLLARS